MKKILYLIKEKRPLQLRLLALFLILIYLPILFNVLFIQRQTINAVREDKLVSIEQTMQRTADSLDRTAADIEKILQDRSNQPGLQKGVEDFHLLPSQAQENFHLYMERQLSEIENATLYLRHSSLFSLEGDHFTAEDFWHEDFHESAFYHDLLSEAITGGWYFLPSENIYRSPALEENLSTSDTSHSLIHVESLENLDGSAVVGYIVSIIDQESFSELYQNVFIGESGQLTLWNDEVHAAAEEDDFPENLQTLSYQSQDFDTLEVNGESTVFYHVPLEIFPGVLSASIPEVSLTHSIEEPLRLNLFLIILISTLISIWIFIEIIIISNIATEKETAHYRLTLSEDLNEKLRMYKHDFANHLQIIQGLIQLGHGDRALKYLHKISDQGKMIYDNYEIGIPELEVVIYDAFQQAKEQGVEININTMELPASLPINIYDLIKALTNVIKNAFEAMSRYPEEHRKLSIDIFEEKNLYVFKISNNTPLIPKDHQSRIFEKGFTTKEEGDGFGLYMVRSLIEKHQGTVELQVDHQGNHFYLKIPKNK
jgi:hypothetical protein